MDTREIQKLIDFISKSELSEVNIETADLKLQVKRNSGAPVQYLQAPVVDTLALPVKREIAQPTETSSNNTPIVADLSNLVEIKSPMIGTFYRSPGPDKDNFVEVGDEISAGKAICIIEAMKLFNEIESEISGKIVKILVQDATPVEYDQPLFLVDPS